MRRFRVKIDDEVFEVEVEEIGQGAQREPVARIPQAPAIPQQPAVSAKPAAAPAPKPAAAPAGAGEVTAPIPGVITEIKVAAGYSVKSGDILLYLEAMKMQNEILAPYDATVTEVVVSQGASVQTGDVLIRLDK
ncbi:MAG TPA: acetyl-CoA carboxylase biotin carboxyl carrier protein subunit [Firmicutes bacterium]|nr:acetyl-CoA carboxylase biotin carboxyl carrier protein subunit [Bacillota bacterium]